MTSLGNLIKILGEVFHDLEARGENVPKELIELIDYCENQHPLDIRRFNALFDSCKEKLIDLSNGGYIYFEPKSEKDKFFQELDELKENINKTQEHTQEEALMRDLYKYSAILYRLLFALAKKNYEQDLKRILLGPNELVASSMRFLLRLEQEINSGVAGRLEQILGTLLSGAYGTFITQLFRLQHFIEDYCPILNHPTCIALRSDENAKRFCMATSKFFEVFDELDIRFHHSIRFMQKVPEGIKFNDMMHTSPMQQFPGLDISMFRSEYDHKVADVTLLGKESRNFTEFNNETSLFIWYA